MKKLLLSCALITGLIFAPVLMAAPIPACGGIFPTTSTENKSNSIILILKSNDGNSIRVFVHKNDVAKAKKLKKGDKIELIQVLPEVEHSSTTLQHYVPYN